MEKTKFENEFKALIKMGFPEEMAYLMTCNKLKVNLEEVDLRINEIREGQMEIKEATKDFLPFEENLKINENNNISNSNND